MVPKKPAQKHAVVARKKAKRAAEYMYFTLTDAYKDGLRIDEDTISDVSTEVLTDDAILDNVYEHLSTASQVKCDTVAECESIVAAQDETGDDAENLSLKNIEFDDEFIAEHGCY